MSEFVKISYPDLVKHQNMSSNEIRIDNKADHVFRLKDMDDTSIYEYDYDCLKYKELTGHPCTERKKQ